MDVNIPISFCLVPTTSPSNLLSTVTAYNEPFQYRFSWEMDQPNSISRSMVHSGFTLYCVIDQVDQSGAFIEAGQSIVTHSIFTSAIQDSYSADIFMPTNCGSKIHYYLCSVSAFNEQGEGPRSENATVYLPCNFNCKCALYSGEMLARTIVCGLSNALNYQGGVENGALLNSTSCLYKLAIVFFQASLH